ncbi:MAG: hypothetical protein WDO24_08550 [Pseudomonadota bacterium]
MHAALDALFRCATTPLGFWILLAAYLVVHAVLRLWASPNIGTDEVEQALFAQTWAWGYNPRQPPLFTWLLLGAYRIFGPDVAAHVMLKYAALGIMYGCAYRCGPPAGRGARARRARHPCAGAGLRHRLGRPYRRHPYLGDVGADLCQPARAAAPGRAAPHGRLSAVRHRDRHRSADQIQLRLLRRTAAARLPDGDADPRRPVDPAHADRARRQRTGLSTAWPVDAARGARLRRDLGRAGRGRRAARLSGECRSRPGQPGQGVGPVPRPVLADRPGAVLAGAAPPPAPSRGPGCGCSPGHWR